MLHKVDLGSYVDGVNLMKSEYHEINKYSRLKEVLFVSSRRTKKKNSYFQLISCLDEKKKNILGYLNVLEPPTPDSESLCSTN